MQTSARNLFTTIRSQGALLPADFLQRIANGSKEIDGLEPESYHLLPGEKLNEAINRSWNRLLGARTAFRASAEKLVESDLGTGLTYDRWLLPLFQELGYGQLQRAKSVEIDGKSYPVSHSWLNSPIHLVGFRIDLDRRTAGVAGAARTSPHGLVQELLNRSDARLWGFVSNGQRLRILRDNITLTRQAFVEFDLQSMLDGEVYADFVVLWLLCHQSRVEAERPELCWLEKWTHLAEKRGTRVLEDLRIGVEAAINALGSGFIAHQENRELRSKLSTGALKAQDYYRQLLRVVYRILFLFVAEERGLLFDPKSHISARQLYNRFYSIARLRRLAERRAGTQHTDLWRALALIFDKLEDGCSELALPALGSFLWSREATSDLAGCQLTNRDLLKAIHALAFTVEGHVRRMIDYKNLGSEELGSVYEALLELHPDLNLDSGTFALSTTAGHERKTTGSYYTPTSLVNCLLDSALDPILDAACQQSNPEQAILNLKICDPAAGSGHFLISAGHRVAKRLASVRTSDEEPSPEATRTALRDVIGRCLYGVDVNPMAAELCKVSLWLEALEPGKPLSFLDHHIRVGNSLLGTTPDLISKGIPDDAFKPIEGDDKKACAALKKLNARERKGFGDLFVREDASDFEQLRNAALAVDELADDTPEAIHRKEDAHAATQRSYTYLRSKELADAWCAAFVIPKVFRSGTRDPVGITHNYVVRIAKDNSLPQELLSEVRCLGRQYQFFHWHLEFPDAFQVLHTGQKPENEQTGWSGGFNVILGNPPWDQIQLDPREFFASSNLAIAEAATMAKRDRLIAELATEDPSLYRSYKAAERFVGSVQHFIHNSGRFPLSSVGRLNTAPCFTETERNLLSPKGSVGAIVPSGIATDSFTQAFFRDLFFKRSLISLFDFENKGLFPGVHSSFKFCLLTLTSPGEAPGDAQFVFFARDPLELGDRERRFTLSKEDIELLNPNTRTCPIFRTRRDAEITKNIYRRVPVFMKDTATENPWGARLLLMFMMNTDSGRFQPAEELRRPLRLYEGKMVSFYDHRAADVVLSETAMVRQGQADELTVADKRDPSRFAKPRYWVEQDAVDERLREVDKRGVVEWEWRRGWLVGWRDVTSPTNSRTTIAAAIPRTAVGHKFPLIFPAEAHATLAGCLLANLSSYVLDYVARQKVGGTSLTYLYIKQFPLLPPGSYLQPCQWANGAGELKDWLVPRVLELTYTAWDLEPFARDSGWSGPPFCWDEERRFLLCCELDAAFFHLYLGHEGEWKKQPEALTKAFPTPRDAVSYIMDTFPIVKRKDEAKFNGDYRTKRVILEIYDAMAESMQTGNPYQTTLDPPPADPRCCHPARKRNCAN
jgi:hypothetical protein